jgi:hypothetical protein
MAGSIRTELNWFPGIDLGREVNRPDTDTDQVSSDTQRCTGLKAKAVIALGGNGDEAACSISDPWLHHRSDPQYEFWFELPGLG